MKKTALDMTRLNECNGKFESDTYYEIPKGIYEVGADVVRDAFYWQSNNDSGVKHIAFHLKNCSNVVLDFNGSLLIIKGRISPFILDNCQNICLKNVVIDTDRPFYSEGVIEDCGADFFDIRIDQGKFPYRVENGSIIFLADTWQQNLNEGINLFLEYDSVLKRPAYNSILTIAVCGHDAHIDERSPVPEEIYMVEERENGCVRFCGNVSPVLRKGNIMTITHERRENSSIFCTDCVGLNFENVEIVHSGSMGIVCQLCGDISIDRFACRLQERSKGCLTLNCDALHFVNCFGKISVKNSVMENMMDDAINVHGIYTVVERVEKDRLFVKLKHFQQYGINVYCKGDCITVLNPDAHGTFKTLRVLDSVLSDEQTVEIRVEGDTSGICAGDIVDNPDRMPEVEVKNCSTGNNRPRGFLISSPKKVCIEENTFYNSAFGLHFVGDTDFWYESSAVRDVVIRANRFEDCGYHYGNYAIAFLPALTAGMEHEGYHKNIVIEENVFETFTGGVLYLKNTEDVQFRHNTIIKTNTYPERGKCHPFICEDNCKKIFIEE